MTEFVPIAPASDIPDGEGRAYPHAGTMIAIFRVGENFYALNDFCPHMGASLSAGGIEGDTVMCPWHAWQFCLKDGTWTDNPNSPLRTPTYTLRIEDGQVCVQVPDPERDGDSSDETNGDEA